MPVVRINHNAHRLGQFNSQDRPHVLVSIDRRCQHGLGARFRKVVVAVVIHVNQARRFQVPVQPGVEIDESLRFGLQIVAVGGADVVVVFQPCAGGYVLVGGLAPEVRGSGNMAPRIKLHRTVGRARGLPQLPHVHPYFLHRVGARHVDMERQPLRKQIPHLLLNNRDAILRRRVPRQRQRHSDANDGDKSD